MIKKFYGQNLEDSLMNDLIIKFYGENFIGSILDIGANDGITLSNSKFFRDKGWKGFLVEAAKKPYERLLNNTDNNTKCFNIALGIENLTLKFYESGRHLGNDDVGLVSSLIYDETHRWRSGGVKYDEYDVMCLNWKSFIEKYNLNDEKFDIISIDIEGMDYEVLNQIDLDFVNCKIVCVEFNGNRKQEFIELLDNFNMELVHENPENLIFVKKQL